jgi:glutamate 5-kinase
MDVHGVRIGVGRISCDATEARSVAGKHGQRPLIHYDYLYLE